MMDINVDLHYCFTNDLTRKQEILVLIETKIISDGQTLVGE